jgi:hypothetical protein
MRLHVLRRWFALCIVAVLTLGLATHGFAAAAMAAKMATATVASDMSKPDGACDGCSGNDAMLGGGCYTACIGAVAILPAGALFVAIDGAAVIAELPDPGHGRSSQPDPYPPRSIVLN